MQEAQTNLTQLQQELETVEIQQLMSDPCDQNGAFLAIAAEVGGIDAQDWAAAMLLRLYHRWAVNHNHKVYLVESEGDLGGVKHATLEIIGLYAYG